MAGSVGLLNIAVSGLTAANRALTTIGHNVANVNTVGYSRQRADLQTRPPQLASGSFVGAGVEVVNTRRLYDAFAVNQLRTSSTSVGYADTYHDLAQSLDNLVADPDTGLNAPLQSFFNATNDLANDPASPAARQALLAEAESLASRFQTLDDALSGLDRQVNQRITDAIVEVNSYAKGIAEVNHDILLAKGGADGAQPNDLFDQRDELVRTLAEKVSVSVVAQDDGTISVATGSGQALVAGTQWNRLVAAPGTYDSTRTEIGYAAGSQVSNVTSHISGGELGALVRFRGDLLDTAHNALGRVAIGLAKTFNDQHALGLTLNGQPGSAFFVDLDGPSTEAVLPNPANGVVAGARAALAVEVTDASKLTTADYQLSFDGTNYTVTRLSDGTQVYSGAALPADLSATDGIRISLSGATPVQSGDRFLVRPTRLAARDFERAVNAPAEIAAASGTGGRGNNENALALSALRTQPLLDNGNATYEDAYGTLIVDVGSRARQAEVNQAAQRALLDEATRARELASGVNLDEEAADLMRFQQLYQANAQVIATANLLFDTLLQAFTR